MKKMLSNERTFTQKKLDKNLKQACVKNTWGNTVSSAFVAWSIHSPWASPAAWCMERKSSARHIRAWKTHWNSVSAASKKLVKYDSSIESNQHEIIDLNYMSIVMKTKDVNALHATSLKYLQLTLGDSENSKRCLETSQKPYPSRFILLRLAILASGVFRRPHLAMTYIFLKVPQVVGFNKWEHGCKWI